MVVNRAQADATYVWSFTLLPYVDLMPVRKSLDLEKDPKINLDTGIINVFARNEREILVVVPVITLL